ncbi:hypothetical protein C8J57DRAFT_1235487 [Mycena rebaudengoi]|nr:hypothetical protein C8J57DRAFT_1235487 [Mycena rebaudengoi]
MPEPPTHLEQFFARYPRFYYDPSALVSRRYHTLCNMYGFPRRKLNHGMAKSELELTAAAARSGFRIAIVRTFNDLFGIDGTRDFSGADDALRVSGDSGLSGIQAVLDVHVNLVDLVDLVDWGMMGAEIHKFETEEDLALYTKATEQFFPAIRGGSRRFASFFTRAHFVNTG